MRLILVFMLLAFVFPDGARAADPVGIAAIVNEDAISVSDVNDRMRLIIASSGLPDNQEIRAKVSPQIMASLIDEQIMMQEAQRQDITITQGEIDQGFATIAAQNNIPVEQFMKMVQQSGINPATMERQIRAQIAWGKVVQKEIRPQIIVTDTDIDSYLARLQSAKGKMEYLAAEIFLPVEEPQQEKNVQDLAEKLQKEAATKGEAFFFKLAQQFSKAAGASKGGDIGWVREGQLPAELDQALQGLGKDSVSPPIRTLSGYHILYVRNTRTISDETIPSREDALNAIGLERLERMQRRYLMDLKSSAFIENRLAT